MINKSILYRWLMYSTFIAVCSEALYINIGFDFKILYLIVMFNFPLLALLGGKIKTSIFFSLVFILFISLFSIHGLTFGSAGQFIGIFFICSYYYCFFSVFLKNVKISFLFDFFCDFFIKINYFFLPLYIIFSLLNLKNGDYRYHSIFMEPAHFCAVAVPVFFFLFFKRKINNENSFLKIFNIYFLFVCILLSQSSVGFIGILLGFLFSINYKRKSSVLVIISIPAAFFLMMLNNNFSMRVMDTIYGISNMDVDNVNISSFALISNIFVIKNVLGTNFLFGTGLGNHILAYNDFISFLPSVEKYDNFVGLNARDANSLFLRMLSEIGVLGVLFIIYLFISIKPYRFVRFNLNVNDIALNKALVKISLIYIFLKLFREGHWFSPEMYFFIFLFFLSRKTNLSKV